MNASLSSLPFSPVRTFYDVSCDVMRELLHGEPAQHGWHLCESKPEELFWNRASGVFLRELKQQYSVGMYRIDFVIRGIGIEIDGKKFHIPEADAIPDARILESDKTIEAIVRVPASAVLYFMNATHAAIARTFAGKIPEWERYHAFAMSVEECQHEHDLIVRREDWEHADTLAGYEGWHATPGGLRAYVGNPLSFLHEPDSRIWPHVSRRYYKEIENPLCIEVHRRAARNSA